MMNHGATQSLSDQMGTRPTQLVVDLKKIETNLNQISAYLDHTPIMAVLKANAYGHGLLPVARHLEAIGIPYFAVAYLEEAVQLRKAGLKTPVLVMSGLLADQIPLYLKYGITLTAPSVEKLTYIDQMAGEMGEIARVHLIIDTGMERIGIHYYNARDLIESSLKANHCQIEGIYSHFANADSTDLSHAYEQLNRFKAVLKMYEEIGAPRPPLRHMANSGAVLQIPEARFDMVRPGILTYGVYPSADVPRTIKVEPAMSWKSKVVYFKVIEPDTPLGYGSTWKSQVQTRIVTVPVGYGDGYFRALSNKGEVLINGRRFPVVGRVCMDQLMVDIGAASAYNGDEVILLGGEEAKSGVTVDEMAGWAETIPYEVLTHINSRVPRKYVGARESL